MKKSKLICTLLATAAFAAASFAEAAPIIRLFDGTTTVEVADNQVGDFNGAAGEVTYIGAVGTSWVTNVTTGLSDSPLPQIDLNSINASNVGAGSQLDIYLTDTNFTLGALSQLATFLGEIGGTTAGMVTWWMYVDDANVAFAETTQIGTGTNVGSPFAGVFTGPASVDGTFSMTLHVRINHNNAGPTRDLTSFDFRGAAIPVPEPGTILLLGIGLLGVALGRRRSA